MQYIFNGNFDVKYEWITPILAVLTKRIQEYFGIDIIEGISSSWISITLISVLFVYALFGSIKYLRDYLISRKK